LGAHPTHDYSSGKIPESGVAVLRHVTITGEYRLLWEQRMFVLLKIDHRREASEFGDAAEVVSVIDSGINNYAVGYLRRWMVRRVLH
jgi:hypothetical protein